MPHEKTDPDIAGRLDGVFDTSRSLDDLWKAHAGDADAKWFGVARSRSGASHLLDFGRLHTLLLGQRRAWIAIPRYPRLVSFVGPTNAGKSALVKMLIDLTSSGGPGDFPSPVVGSTANDAVPTSGDVHLYLDPSTSQTRLPILYADCEGFEGGERTPMGSFDIASVERRSEKTRPRTWVINGTHFPDRESVVTRLYPRLLYAFSDCIVFTIRNPKTFQSTVLGRLIEWGEAAYAQSVHQPILPRCILVLNTSDPGLSPEQWDPENAASILLDTVGNVLSTSEGVPKLRDLAHRWRSRGREIRTTRQLMDCYYSAFHVVRVPTGPRYVAMYDQAMHLHASIRSGCLNSYAARRKAHLLLGAEEFNTVIDRAFEHFTTAPDKPFDFGLLSLQFQPVPAAFRGHASAVCNLISHERLARLDDDWTRQMFEKLMKVLSSCVLVEGIRRRQERRHALFPDFEGSFRWIWDDFFATYPCTFSSGDRHCTLIRKDHNAKGHRDRRGFISGGDYQTELDRSQRVWWMSGLRREVSRVRAEVGSMLNKESFVSPGMEAQCANQIHARHLEEFLGIYGPAVSIKTTLTCLFCWTNKGPPSNALPCGHVICHDCFQSCGVKLSENVTALWSCPMHASDPCWPQPVIVCEKPLMCGIRTLILEGGGMRVMTALECLRSVFDMLGGEFEVSSFFDLMVGGETGGLAAVMLASGTRTLDESIESFIQFCKRVYVPRPQVAPVITQVTRSLTHGMEEGHVELIGALQQMFGNEGMLFRAQGKSCHVAVAASVAGKPVLLGNYRRNLEPGTQYDFDVPLKPSDELRAWECVAASMATSGHFAPFRCRGKTYVEERQVRSGILFDIARREPALLWPEFHQEDLFLSLAPGQYCDPELPNRRSALRARTLDSIKLRAGPTKSIQVDTAESAWQKVSRGTDRSFYRLDPQVNHPEPASGEGVENLQGWVREAVRAHGNMQQLKVIAYRLLASAFYFVVRNQDIQIFCRFPSESEDLRRLGRYLLHHCVSTSGPHFEVGCPKHTPKPTILLSRVDALAMSDGKSRHWPVHLGFDNSAELTIVRLVLTGDDDVLHMNHISGSPRWGAGKPYGREDAVPCPDPDESVDASRYSTSSVISRSTAYTLDTDDSRFSDSTLLSTLDGEPF